MVAKRKSAEPQQIEVRPIEMDTIECHIVGITPLIMHRFAFKAWQELLLPLPSQKKNAAAKTEGLKHDPLMEFRQCCYLNKSESEPTALHYPAGAFSKAMASAALDLPGANKSQILRLVSITTTQVNIYGTPFLGMDMVRNSDPQRKPDVRTRAYFPEWACAVEVEFVPSLIGATEVVNLLNASGRIVGLGDYRPQKGGQYGKFVVVSPDDKNFRHIQQQGRTAQKAALAHPSFFNDEAAELYAWFTEEMARREKIAPSSVRGAKPKVQAANAKRNGETGQAKADLS